ncbi:MAG: response regulator [Aquisalinus sp.]|nr:response regulator [Aquisalinus sp.]
MNKQNSQIQADELDILRKRLDRERRAREEAEKLLEAKSDELFTAFQRLEEESALAKTLRVGIEAANDGIALVNSDGEFSYMNQAHETMFGYGEGELLGRPWTVLYTADELARFDSDIMPQFGKDGFWRGEATGLSKDGRSVQQEVVLTQVASGGLICATRDITKRKERERLRRELEESLKRAEHEAALFTISSAFAHDFNNLVCAINGHALLLRNRLQDNHKAIGNLNSIFQAIDQAAALLDALGTEQKANMLKTQRIDLGRVVEMVSEISKSVKPDRVTYTTDLLPNIFVLGNETLLSRCLLNLIKNAFEAIPETGSVRVSMRECPSPVLSENAKRIQIGTQVHENLVVLEITDTGEGVAAEVSEEFLQPYVTTKSREKGTGLGLQSLKVLTESGTASAEIESEIGVGTRFRIFLERAEIEKHLDQGHNGCKKSAELHYLIVDDDALIGEMLREMLNMLSVQATWVDSPFEALRILEADSAAYDTVITDINMPEMNGIELATKIRAAYPHIPIVGFSGQADYLKKNPLFTSLLKKPFDFSDLQSLVGVS